MAQVTIRLPIDRVTYPAAYELKRGLVTVRTDIGTRSAPLGNTRRSMGSETGVMGRSKVWTRNAKTAHV